MAIFRYALLVVLLTALPSAAFAYGAHDSLSCTGCHGIHTAKGDLIFAVEPNTKVINPRTKQALTGVTALCLGCHETPENGGMGIKPVSASHSHPYGVSPNPKRASVPDSLLRDGRLECVGCHDPHPSNPNYKYLRVDTSNGAKMPNFCGVCHTSKPDPSALKDIRIFNSMDERNFSASAGTKAK